MTLSLAPKAFWPLAITAGVNDKIDFVSSGTYAATIAAATYYSAAELATAVDAALTAALAGTWTVNVSANGRITISYSAAFSLKFSTGTSAAISARDVLGFGAVDTTSATSATGTLQHQNGWYLERPVTFDGREDYERSSAGAISLEGQAYALTFGAARETRRVTCDWIPEWKTKIAREGTHTNEALERLWLVGYARFRWWPDAAAEGTYGDFALDHSQLSAFVPERDPRAQIYSYTLKFRKYVA